MKLRRRQHSPSGHQAPYLSERPFRTVPGGKPSEIPSVTRSVSAFLPGTVSVGPRFFGKVADGWHCSEPLYTVKPSEPISTWDELLRFDKDCEPSLWKKRWIFRAQEDSTWCLTSSLERAIYRQHGYFLKDGRKSLEDAQKWKSRLLRQFQRIAPMFLSTARQEQLDGMACAIAPSWRPNEALGLNLLILDRCFLRNCKG